MNGNNQHEVAEFYDEETYMACLPSLKKLGKKQGYEITETVIEK